MFAFSREVDYEVRDLEITAGDDVAFGHQVSVPFDITSGRGVTALEP